MENAIYDPRTHARRQRPGRPRSVSQQRDSAGAAGSGRAQDSGQHPESDTGRASINNWDQSFPADTIKSISTSRSIRLHRQRASSRATTPGTGARTTTGRTACRFRLRKCGASRPPHDTVRVTYDWTLSPTTLLNTRVGYVRHWNPDFGLPEVREFDPVAGLGLVGASGRHGVSRHRRPCCHADRRRHVRRHGGRREPAGDQEAAGARQHHALAQHAHLQSRVRVAQRHLQQYLRSTARTGSTRSMPQQTGLPSTQGQNLGGGAVGLPYASFLMGRVNNAFVSNRTGSELAEAGRLGVPAGHVADEVAT